MIEGEKASIYDNHVDDHVNDTIIKCLDLNNLQSFFLFAGAGSGKTRSLVTVLNVIREKNYKELQNRFQKVAIITYTNAACEEIRHRLDYDPLFSVSTIHTFIWELIKGYNIDIKQWLRDNLLNQIEELKSKQIKGRIGTNTYVERIISIENKEKRLQNLDNITRFTYNPNGLNFQRESLNHSEVISIGAYFLSNKPLMKKILVTKFPILLIDESQDTNKDLIDALFCVEKSHQGKFSLGLFGDTMQRIYSDGKVDLGVNLPENWAKPAKKMNHRCPSRVVKLINRIRSAVDNQEQIPKEDSNEGVVRIFILPSNIDKTKSEKLIVKRMEGVTGDRQWESSEVNYTTLILEHHMAASRLGFQGIFQPLYQIEKIKTELLDGSLDGLKFFTQIILPIYKANSVGDKLITANICRKYCPLLKIEKNDNEQLLQVKKVNEAIIQLLNLWKEKNDPKCVDVLRCVYKYKLFEIPESLLPHVNSSDSSPEVEAENNELDTLTIAWSNCLNAPFSQIIAYDSYVNGSLNFLTHQGVKGLEFKRVMVVIDDNEARGFLFSYEKLFGAKEKTVTDIKNENEGKDTSIDRTRRLFYVACSRAEESLAIVAYSEEPELVKQHVLKEGWFEDNEVEMITDESFFE